MDAAMKSLNLEQISALMDKFEKQFEDLDVQSSYMENTMSQTTTTSVPRKYYLYIFLRRGLAR